jgi:L-serine dehydratase
MLDFRSGEELLGACKKRQISIAEAMQLREELVSEVSRADMRAEMKRNLGVMREAVTRGLVGDVRSLSGLSGGDAALMKEHAGGSPLLGADACHAAAAAMAVVEVNASMGRIVAAPTAGASGVLPGVLVSLSERRGWAEEALVDALFTAGAVGMLIASHATIAGADGGCQAETGSAAAMAAAALVELTGGTPEAALTAAAIALKNVLGLVCDPVAGLVECPCIKRNAIGAVNALLSADLALAGVRSHIPFDEVVGAMRSVGAVMRPELRETALGGLAATPTGRAIAQRMREKQAEAKQTMF